MLGPRHARQEADRLGDDIVIETWPGSRAVGVVGFYGADDRAHASDEPHEVYGLLWVVICETSWYGEAAERPSVSPPLTLCPTNRWVELRSLKSAILYT
jgi:hypothetical protein